MKSKRYMLVVLSILMILFVFVSSAGAADANATDVLSVDESSNTINEKLALDYNLDNAVANDTNDVENDKEILQNPNSDDDILSQKIMSLDFPKEINANEPFIFSYMTTDPCNSLVLNMNGKQVGSWKSLPSSSYIISTYGIQGPCHGEVVVDGARQDFTTTVNNNPGPAKMDLNWLITAPKEVEPGKDFNIKIEYNGPGPLEDGVTMRIPGQGDSKQNIPNIFKVNLKENSTITFAYMGDSHYYPKVDRVDITVKSPPVTDTWYVNASATGGDGKTRGTAFKTLKDALTNSELQEGNTIMIASGEYKGENNTGLTINKKLNFIKYGDDEAIFDAESQRRIWTVTATSVNITGLTFKNGKADKGGALWNDKNGFNVDNCTFIDNFATQRGGAIHSEASTNVVNSIFIGNNGTVAAGAINNDKSYITVNNCSFVNNRADYGGVIVVDKANSASSISNSLFLNNSAGKEGSVVRTYGYGTATSTTVADCIIINNSGSTVFQAYHQNADNTIITKNNWYGSNSTNKDTKPVNTTGNVTLNEWLFLNATADPAELNVGENSTIKFKLDLYNSTTKETSSYDASKMNVVLELSQTLGQLNQNTTLFGEDVIYTAKQEGNASVTGKFETASYTINLKNNASEIIPTNITVEPISLNLTVDENGTINATLDPSEAGHLEVDYNETIIEVKQNEVTGEWIVTARAGGKTNITFSFAGSEGYAAAENKTVTVTVSDKPAPSINVVAENLTKYYHGPEQFSVNVTDEEGKGISDKNVSILINGVNNKRTTDGNGIARLNINLPSGEYVANVTVDDITVNATVTVLPTVSGSDVRKVYGQKASYNATFLDEEGEYLPNGTEVSFNINGDIQKETISDDNGLASLNINLSVGDYIVTATNPVTGENASNTITVTQAESDITVNGKNITVSDVNAVIADIVLPGDATGNVSVTIGDNTTVYDVQTSNHTSRGGKLIMFISNNGLNVGEYNISAVYEGDTNYKASNASDQFVVSDKKYLNITATADPITVGDNATVVVTGLENATGEVSVIIKVDEMYSAPINEGVATVTVPGLTETVTADVNYLGDDNYNPANTTVKIIVSSPGKMNLTISASAEPITVGENATVVVTGFPLTSYGAPSGIVTVTVGDKIFSGTLEPYMIGGLAAEIIVPGLNESAVAVVNYLGDDKYNPANTTVNITVYPKEKENANMSLYAPEIGESENATIYVTLPEDATGTVTATDQGENFTSDVVNGTAIIILPVSDTNRTVPVTYSGDDKYYSETKEVNITVVDSSDIIIAPDVTKYYGGPERFVVTVTDYKGNPLVNKSVNITINGRNYTRNTNESGVASLAINLPSNEYNATVSIKYLDPVHAIITVLSTVNGTDVVKMYRNDTQYYATFIDTEGKFLADGTVVKFNINGVVYERKVSGDKGLAKLNINLPAGEYVITAINPVTGENAANNITVLSTVVENRDIVKYYRNATQYTVKVLGADGNPVGEGKIVSFNINGVVYKRQTNASSIAQLNINLPPGNYVITASYEGCSVSNDIVVLPVLSASDLRMKYMDGSKFKATLLDGQGKPYAEQKVQFNVNGVLYSRTTDSNGQAELNIRLPSGEYIITSSYNGANIANKITITP